MPIPRVLLLLLVAAPAFAQPPAPPSAQPTSTVTATPAVQPGLPPQMQQAIATSQQVAPALTGADRVDAYKGLITTLHEGGENKSALAQLQILPLNIEAQLNLDPDFLATSAGIYSALGDDATALRLLDAAEGRYLFTRFDVPMGLQVQQCYLLLNLGDEAGLHSRLLSVTQQAEHSESLTDEQRNSLNNLWIYFALRRSNEETSAGRQRNAMRILITALQTYPDNTLIKRSLAGAFLNAGDAKTALQLYKEAGLADATAGEYQGAIGAAFATGDRQDAEKWLHLLLEKSPTDPKVLTLAAKFERARGNRKLAASYYRAALENMPKEKRALTIPASLRDQAPDEVKTPQSPLTTLASVTDPLAVGAPRADNTATIAFASDAQTSRGGNFRLPGERVSPRLMPIFIPQQSAPPSAAIQESTAEYVPSAPVPTATANSPRGKVRPSLRQHTSAPTNATTSLDSYAPTAMPPLYRFQPQATQRLGEYDPSR
jgi:tetratricopeptide (TPR) repeat protein